jgi:WD40-like Beta Propeller Repeat
MRAPLHRTALAACVAVAGALLLAGGPPAEASSIVYMKGGTIYRASPDGRRVRVVRRPRGESAFRAVTQDDRGRVWAVHSPSRRWQRFTARGRRRGRPFDTAGTGVGRRYDPQRGRFGYVGPLDPQVSGDGRLLAFWGIREDVAEMDPNAIPGERGARVQQVAAAEAVFSDRDEVAVAGGNRLEALAWPSWLSDGTVVMGATMNGVWYLPPGAPAPLFWFNAPSLLRIAHPEVSRLGGRLAAVVDTAAEGRSESRDDEIGIFRLAGPPPAVPRAGCAVANPAGRVEDVSWAPDGRRLAWADRRGVWVARLAFARGGCELRGRRLLARRAGTPDWGPWPS